MATVQNPYTSLEEIMTDGNKIWDTYLHHVKTDAEFRNQSMTDKLKEYQSLFPRFHQNFPIQLRYMIQFQRYRRKALKRYVNKLQKVPPRSMDEKLERDAEYVQYLYRYEAGKDYNPKYAATLKSDIYAALKKEKDDFEEDHKKTQEKVKKYTELNETEKRERTLEYLKQKLKEREENLIV